MDCLKVQSNLCEMSAELLPKAALSSMREHLSECTPCRREWQNFQQTLNVLSTATQPVLADGDSRRMWHQCSEQLHERIEQRRLAARRPGLWQWVLSQPRTGWAALGAAVVILGSVWVLGPADGQQAGTFSTSGLYSSIQGSGTSSAGMGIDLAGEPAPASNVAFRRPSAEAASMINHHAAMAFDPFTDHVGTTLVSQSATAGTPGP